ncbi:MAG: hypothetical protein FGM22_08250 [Burkholderiaceae bacterium]|nr:hypothetical protein [Burkholderiaceae bacterium]
MPKQAGLVDAAGETTNHLPEAKFKTVIVCPHCCEWTPYEGQSGAVFCGECTEEYQVPSQPPDARSENARLRDDKARLDGLEDVPFALEIVCKRSQPKSDSMPSLRDQIDFFLSNAEVSHAAPPAASNQETAQRGGVALH